MADHGSGPDELSDPGLEEDGGRSRIANLNSVIQDANPWNDVRRNNYDLLLSESSTIF